MLNKSEAVLREPAPVLTKPGPRAPHETARLYLGYLVLVTACLLLSVVAIVMRSMLPRSLSQRLGRSLLGSVFRAYLRLLELMGACRFDLAALDGLRDAPTAIIAPNHPSLLDAIMILSRLPEASCVMKAEIMNNVLYGAIARLLGYIRNNPLRTMVHLAVDDLHNGSHLLLFPEGTRTQSFPIGPLQGTTSLIAKHAGVPVQTLFIETNSCFLGKGWSLLWTPKMPVTYRVRLGKRFDPPEDTVAFSAELARYFESELATAELPSLPCSVPPA